jgi:outer membrane lipoprotein-sorting protein
MAFAPVLLLAASAATAAIGAISSSRAQAASYKSQADAARYNADVNMQNATASETAASANELAMRRQNDQRMGAMRAQAAEGGGGFTGTNLEVLNQSAANMELDALNTRYRGQMQARGMLAAANLDEYQARAADMNAHTSITGGYLGAAASALGRVSNYANYRSLNYGYTG